MNKKMVVIGGLVTALSLGAVGGSTLNAIQASAADTSTTSTTTAQNTQTPPQGRQFDPSKGGHMANGKTETLLTGDTAAKVTAAALKDVPGGTIERVETDADGGVYEAHMTKADGSRVTVIFDANYNVTDTQSGMGPGGPAH